MQRRIHCNLRKVVLNLHGIGECEYEFREPHHCLDDLEDEVGQWLEGVSSVGNDFYHIEDGADAEDYEDENVDSIRRRSLI